MTNDASYLKKSSKTYSGEYGAGTRNAFPGSAREKTSISIAGAAPAVSTSCSGLENSGLPTTWHMNPATALDIV